MVQVIAITGASSGFGALTARALAHAGHTVFAGMRSLQADHHAVTDLQSYAKEHGIILQAVEQDVTDDASVQKSVDTIMGKQGRIDAIIHNAGHMSFGPTEAFTPAQLADLYNINVLSTQRVNRAVLPHMRRQRSGLLMWVSSSSVHGATPPFLAGYFAAKAGMDALASSYAAEVSRFGIESSIIVPGAFTKGTNHFKTAGQPADQAVAKEYMGEAMPYEGMPEKANEGLASLEPEWADVGAVAKEIVRVVGTKKGERPFRAHVDPSDDGSELVSGVRDRLRREMYRRVGLEVLLQVR